MQTAIGYLRVSTREQGRSGLSLAAQRFEIEAFGAREGFTVNSWYQDIQTGAGADALQIRQGLATALKEARAARCPLIVSRLDRLSRNVHFISGLIEHRVHFMVAAFGRDVDNFLLHIYASVAEHERNQIAERTRAAVLAQRRQGRRLGIAGRSKAFRRRFWAAAAAGMQKAAMERAEASRVHIEWALSQPGKCGRPISCREAAKRLNERELLTPRGFPWSGETLADMARRLGLPHRRGRVPTQVLDARVRAILEQQPDIKVMQMVRIIQREYPIGARTACVLMRRRRHAIAGRNLMQRRTRWPLDYRTPARLRIAAIWKRHPEFTATQIAHQVIKELRPAHTIDYRWVQKVVRECLLASGSPAELRKRIRFYHRGLRVIVDRPVTRR